VTESSDVRLLSEIDREIAEIERKFHNLAPSVFASRSDRDLLAHEAEWHIRGLLYHLKALAEGYSRVASEVSARAATGASVIVMHSPEMQVVLFEFYALVVLARIALDELRKYTAPLFATPAEEIPLSVTAIVRGTTDCPVYSEILGGSMSLLNYLLDVRDCLVHRRSFATGDNSVAVLEGIRAPADLLWPLPLIRLEFRPAGDGIAVNLFLPDQIYERSSNGERVRAGQDFVLVREFTYTSRINLLSQSREFVKLVASAIGASLILLSNVDEARFVWTRRT
jgi:hypothetical protein